MIGEQQVAIQDLSTPVLLLRDRLLLLPIIGLIDSDRARQLTEQLLGAIRQFCVARGCCHGYHRRRRGRLEGREPPDQTVDAARLLGTTVIVTGVSPAIAQTIVTVGVNLRGYKRSETCRAGSTSPTGYWATG